MKKISTLFVLVFGGLACLAQDSSLYHIFYSNRKAGFVNILRKKNINTIHYMYNDRGRGPDQFFTIETDDQQRLVRFEQSGVEYMKDTVSLRIFRKDSVFCNVRGRDTIRTDFKSLGLGNFAWSGLHEFFFPIYTNAALHGEQPMTYEKVLQRTFRVNKKPVTAILYQVTIKKSTTASFVWLYPDNRLLAQVYPWNDFIEAGKEVLRPELRRIHDSVFNHFLEEKSTALLQKATNCFALFNCNIVDVVNGNLLPNQTLLVSNGKIEAIGDTASVVIPANYKRINASNKYVMPGLWDMHAHTFPGEGIAYLINGITSIRDLGNNLQLPEIKQKTEQGILVGPRIAWMSGFIDYNDEMAGPCGIFINNITEGIEAVRTYHRMGYQSIKLYSSIKPEYVKVLAAEAHRLGMKVHGHVPAFMTAEEAIRDGYDEVNHLNMLVLGYFGTSVDTRTRVRLTLMKERAYEASPGTAYGQRLIELMVQKKTVLDPTSILYGPIQTKAKMNLKDSLEKASVDTLFAWLRVLHQKGIRFVPGTDAGGGNGLSTELKNYAQIGMSNADVLRCATIWSAEYAGLSDVTGSVSVNKTADLIITSNNPLERISALDNIQIVVTNGKLFYVKDLRTAASGSNAGGAAHQH